MEELIRGIKIGIDCVENDPVDIRCGGPKYLGFHFILEESTKDEMKEFILEALECIELPVKNIYYCSEGDYPKSKIWTKEKIVCEMRRLQDEIKWEYSGRKRR